MGACALGAVVESPHFREESQVDLMEKHLTCASFLQKMAALLSGKRLDTSNGFVTAPVSPFGHEVTENIPSMYLSSMPGMRALEKHTEL